MTISSVNGSHRIGAEAGGERIGSTFERALANAKASSGNAQVATADQVITQLKSTLTDAGGGIGAGGVNGGMGGAAGDGGGGMMGMMGGGQPMTGGSD